VFRRDLLFVVWWHFTRVHGIENFLPKGSGRDVFPHVEGDVLEIQISFFRKSIVAIVAVGLENFSMLLRHGSFDRPFCGEGRKHAKCAKEELKRKGSRHFCWGNKAL